ncbi:MAG TPA: hypothetical protein VFH47_02080, partial [Candidatus Thermoplasmatota archaeon]|nr:hypothetical protein [Candidatus Thermoplasmatota archaeon]
PERPDVRLERVRHEPERPKVGEAVRTVATLRNLGAAPASLRVVLVLDGLAVVEEQVEVDGRGSRTLVLPWTASTGRNKVALQVYPA